MVRLLGRTYFPGWPVSLNKFSLISINVSPHFVIYSKISIVFFAL